MPERKFIVHSTGSKDGNPYGLGIGQKIWWPVFFKRQSTSFWLQFLDKFGAPTAVGEYEPGAQNIDELEEALARIAHDAGVAVPRGCSIQLLEATRGGQATHESLVRYMDEQIAGAILGDGGGRGTGGVGGELASAAILRNELRLELVQFDSDILSETLNQTLIAWDVALNVPGANPPRLVREIKQDEDLEARAKRDKLIFDMGFRPTLAYLTETYGGEWTETDASQTGKAERSGSSAVSSDFAEGDAPDPGQAVLDAALRALPAADIEAAMQALLAPAIAALQAGGTPDEAGDALLEVFPKLDSSAIEKLLARAIFVADLWGRISGQHAGG